VPPLSPSLPGPLEGGGAFLAEAFLVPAFLAAAFLAEADGGALRAAVFLAGAFLAGALSAAAFLAGAFAGVAFVVVAFAVGALVAGAFVVAAVAVAAVAVAAVAAGALGAPDSVPTGDVAGSDSADDPGRCGAGSGVDCCCRMNRSSAWTAAPSSTTRPTRNSRRLTAPEANPSATPLDWTTRERAGLP
jgi:hypothetical protein